LAVIIVSWNTRELLRACLASVLDNAPDCRLIVVDNASTDGTADMIRTVYPQVELIASAENIGFVRANNLALERVLAADKSDYVWLLNPDTIVHPGAVRTLLAFAQGAPRCGLLCPKLENPDGSLQHGAFALPGLTQLAIDVIPRLQVRFRDTQLDGRYPPARYAAGQPFAIGTPLGAAMLARVAAVRQIGMLDTRFHMYSEEIDWAARMHAAGWACWCEPRAVVTHYGGASSSQASERTERLKWQSRQAYFAKHYSPLKRWLARRLVPREFRA
jgi:N-acetylglucosaminyl-diphospho-decaprenol L-rhamnosyltransferase